MTFALCSAIAPNAALSLHARGRGAAIPPVSDASAAGLRYQRDTKIAHNAFDQDFTISAL